MAWGARISRSYCFKRKLKNHVDPSKWNKLIDDKNTFLIDARKPFEYQVGTFKNAKNPKVKNFRDFPNYLQNLNKNKKIAMFCTGGIRCEKASVYLEKKGFKNVYQLKGGIINYLNKIKKKYPKIIGEIRGVGLIKGLKMLVDNVEFMKKLMDHKMLTVKAEENVIRLFPPLIVSNAELDEAINKIEIVCKEMS